MSRWIETNKEKLQFLIREYLNISQKKLADEFEVSETEMSKIVNDQENKLKNVHLLGFCYLHDIPYQVFKNKKLNSEEKIISYLDNYKSSKKKDIFLKDEKLMNQLVGSWYAYLYPSNLNSPIKTDGVWIVKTTITEDYKVIDEFDNEGILQLGRKQSIICKESYDEKNLTIIRFLNRQVAYNIFHFVIISHQNITDHVMVNFGFYARKKYLPEVAKKILGDIDKVQLKLDLEFDDRMSKLVRI